MDPHPNQRNQLASRGGGGGGDFPTQSALVAAQGAQDVGPGQTPEEGRSRPAADRRPQCSGAFTVIPPNQSRRSEMKAAAQKEEEALQRWKETHKPAPLQLNPERLGGGGVTQAEARQRQLTELRCSKLQKKLKKEDMDKKRRQEEEEELQSMKAKQREKSERLEERRQQEDERRREKLHQDHLRTTERFLQRVERSAAPSGSAAHASSLSKVANQQPEKLAKSMEEVQLEHKRVNQAFLDKLQRKTGGMEAETSSCCRQGEELPRWAAGGDRTPPTHLEADPEQSRSDWMQETDPDWNLMKLMSNFSDCSRDFLQDILDQCNGDYQQAHTLLLSTLS